MQHPSLWARNGPRHTGLGCSCLRSEHSTGQLADPGWGLDHGAVAPPGVPVGLYAVLIVQPEPSCARGWHSVRITGHDLQIDATAKLQTVIVGAHVDMTGAEWHLEAQAFLYMRAALRE